MRKWILTILSALALYAILFGIANAEQKSYRVVPKGHISKAITIICLEREYAVDILSEWALNGWKASLVRYGIYRMQFNDDEEPLCLMGEWMVAYAERTDHFIDLENPDGTIVHQFVNKVYNIQSGRPFWMVSNWDVVKPSSEPIKKPISMEREA